MSTSDLQLILDRMGSECPALVKERLLSRGVDAFKLLSASFTNGYSLLISNHDLFVWNDANGATTSRALSSTASKPVSLFNLPNSGLIYTSQMIVVYQNGDIRGSASDVGVLAVSGEGIVRHWLSWTSQRYQETTLELDSEVVLSVELLESPARFSGASFILTTTSGNIYILRTNKKTGAAEASKIAGMNSHGIRRRLSSMLFGAAQGGAASSRVMCSLLYWRDGEEIEDEEEEVKDPVVILLSRGRLTAFDVLNKASMWNFDADGALTTQVSRLFKDPIALINFLDIQHFRDGLLLLCAVTHESTDKVDFVLSYLKNPDFNKPQIGWTVVLPQVPEHDQLFTSDDEGTFLDTVRLSIPLATDRSTLNDRNDGVLILHNNFVMSVTLDDVNKNGGIPLCRSTMLPGEQVIIGFGTDERYCYIVQYNGIISTVRLLPKGFDESGQGAVNLADILPDEDLFDADGQVLHRAFYAFAVKDLVKSGLHVAPLLEMNSTTLIGLIQRYLVQGIDSSDPDALTDIELRDKKIVCERFVVFLQHLGLLEKAATAYIASSRQRVTRSGASILSEMCERVSIAVALNNWRSLSEDNSEALDLISGKIAKEHNYKSDGDCIFQRLSLLHCIPSKTVETTKALLQQGKRKSSSERCRLLLVFADLLATFFGAIQERRSSSSSVPVKVGDEQWTSSDVADALLQKCMLLTTELASANIGVSDRAQILGSILKLAKFHLCEMSSAGKKIDGHPVLLSLYDNGYTQQATELAEKYMDFKVICKITLELDRDSRAELLEEYKNKFAAQDFDLYLCEYLKRKNMNEELLEQRGDRVDRFLSSLDSVRWRRELQNEQYDQASQSLMSIADREENDVRKQKSLFALAKLSALCAENTDSEIIRHVDAKMDVINHQMNIPSSIMNLMYADNPKRPLSIQELVETQKFVLTEDRTLLESFLSALDILSTASPQDVGGEEKHKEAVENVYKQAIRQTEWQLITSYHAFCLTILGQIILKLADDKKKQMVLPHPASYCTKDVTSKCTKFASWFKKCLDSARRVDIEMEIA